MNAAEFARKRARIIQRARGRSAGFYDRAMAHLVREAGAQEVIVGGQVVAWELPAGVACAKHRYTCGDAANEELANIQQHGRGYKLPARAYACGFCGGWHLTSQAKRAA
jgi:hypothetical protein